MSVSCCQAKGGFSEENNSKETRFEEDRRVPPTSFVLLKIMASRRKAFYPKTNVAIIDTKVKGARTVLDGFRWATRFIDRLARAFGILNVLDAFHDWKWDCTTCFSGIGCPETVPWKQ